ncbi:MAG: hypothetical protein ACI31A_04530 [Candidatus Limisoma sp.]
MKFIAGILVALFQSNSYWRELLIILGILVVASFIYNYFKNKKSTENQAEQDPETERLATECQTMNLMLKVLTDFGCQPHTESQEYIDVDYQGAHFRIEIFGRYARIWYLSWGYVEPGDPDYPNV